VLSGTPKLADYGDWALEDMSVVPDASGNLNIVGTHEITLALYYVDELATDLWVSIDAAADAANPGRRSYECAQITAINGSQFTFQRAYPGVPSGLATFGALRCAHQTGIRFYKLDKKTFMLSVRKGFFACWRGEPLRLRAIHGLPFVAPQGTLPARPVDLQRRRDVGAARVHGDRAVDPHAIPDYLRLPRGAGLRAAGNAPLAVQRLRRRALQPVTAGRNPQTVQTASYGANRLGLETGEFVHINLARADPQRRRRPGLRYPRRRVAGFGIGPDRGDSDLSELRDFFQPSLDGPLQNGLVSDAFFSSDPPRARGRPPATGSRWPWSPFS